jgi:hypothetical protein
MVYNEFWNVKLKERLSICLNKRRLQIGNFQIAILKATIMLYLIQVDISIE